MSNDVPTPPEDGFPQGRATGMQDILLSPPTGTQPASAPAGPWQPPTAEELQKLLPQYEITALLGRGGMGAVYKGTQIALDRPVAIKILSNRLEEADVSFAERFKNEARAMAKLSHPGIVGVYDFGETAGGLLYIVMEFIEGTDVARMLAQQKRLHTEHAMAITAHVCDALAYAHERGIIHRDIKPANIMVGYDGVVKVADFGLAKMSSANTQSGLTQSGMAMGTLHYMAPEALMLGSAVDHRADVYAVGVMLYQMLTGKIPQGLFELPSLQVPGLDPRYDGIIGKALREDRELRYPSVLNMRHDLDAILTQPVVKVEAAAEKAPAALNTLARPQRPEGQPYRPPQLNMVRQAPSKSSSGMILAVVVMLVLAGAAAFYFRGMDRGQVAQSEPSTNVVANGGDWIDLLPLADPQTDVVSGKWIRVADGLHGEHIAGTKGAQVLQLPYEPPEEYDFRIAYTTMEGNREASQILSAFGRQFTWGTASGANEKWSGFNMVNGKPMMLNGAGVKLPAQREMNRRYESLVEVRRDRVTGYVDGEKLVEWKTDYSDLSMDPPHAIPNPRALGIAIWWSKTVFHEVSVREVTGRGKRLREPGASPVAVEAATVPSGGDLSQTTKDKPFVNSLGMKFVPVPGTKVLFCIHETRYRDFAAYAENDNSLAAYWKQQSHDGLKLGDNGKDHPVVNVNKKESQGFCQWLSQKESHTYRLPTDAEWSAAAGVAEAEQRSEGMLPSTVAIKQLGFPWGDTWPPPSGSGNYSDESRRRTGRGQFHIAAYDDGYPTTSPVMRFPPNHLGIYDMGGNVWEWCEDKFHSTSEEIGLRGGSWHDGQEGAIRLSRRTLYLPDQRNAGNGFRCVVEIENAGVTVTKANSPALSAFSSQAKPPPQNSKNASGEITMTKEQDSRQASPSGPTTWTDTKGRSLTATFKSIASGNVLLDIAGKVTPVPLNTLSAESQKLARDYQQALGAGAANSAQPSQIPADAFFYGTSRYAYFAGAMNWQEARSRAESLGGHLVSFNTQAEEAAVEVQLRSRLGTGIINFWIGGILDTPGGSWHWTTGEPFTHTHWGPNEPNNANAAGERGALPFVVACHLSRNGYTGGWHDYAASHPNWQTVLTGYLVEWDNVQTSVQPAPAAPSAADIVGTWKQTFDGKPDPVYQTEILADNRAVFVSDTKQVTGTWSIINGGLNMTWSNGASYTLAFPAGSPVTLMEGTGSRQGGTARFTVRLERSASTDLSRPTASSNVSTITKNAPFVNSLGMKFVPVPITGGPTAGKTVLFSIWDTRVQDYEVFSKDTNRAWPKPNFEQAPTHPAVQVSWEDAQAFCAWMTERERASGKLGSNERYRLPSDHEWSCAVGLGEREDAAKSPKEKNSEVDGLFPWGTQWPPPKGAGNYAGEELQAALATGKTTKFDPEAVVIAGYQDDFVHTSPVGSFAANPFGLYDMGGNVIQWCEDLASKEGQDRVLRGQAWSSLYVNIRAVLRSSLRNYVGPNFRSDHSGFRVVLETSASTVAAAANVKPLDPQFARVTKDTPFVNTLGMNFVPVPGTKVLFSIWETRVRDYTVFARSNKVDDSWQNRQRNGIPVARERDHPVVAVNWEEAQAFCRWLTDKETTTGKLTKGWLYRLPKDEEWSAAVGLISEQGTTPSQKGARSQEHYPWGNTFPPPDAKIGNYADSSWHDAFPNDMWMNGYTDGFATTAPVGSFPANLYGIHDLGGNAWEWCDDLLTPQVTKRVLRGGSWGNSSRDDLRSACRYFFGEPENRAHAYGFRCVLEILP